MLTSTPTTDVLRKEDVCVVKPHDGRSLDLADSE